MRSKESMPVTSLRQFQQKEKSAKKHFWDMTNSCNAVELTSDRCLECLRIVVVSLVNSIHLLQLLFHFPSVVCYIVISLYIMA